MLKNLSTLTEPTHSTHACQVVTAEHKKTNGGGDQITLHFDDGGGAIKMNFFDKHPSFVMLQQLQKGMFIRITGTFTTSKWGPECADLTVTQLSDEEKSALFAGPPTLRAKQDTDWKTIMDILGTLNVNSPYHMMLTMFIGDHEALYRRAAAARGNHHARRGGLVEHVAYMMKNVRSICENYQPLYPALDPALALCATFFHDVGKLWENNYPETGFEQVYDMNAEAVGHIVLGIGLVNAYWQKLPEALRKEVNYLIALRHCIAAHHGTKEWGSPTEPACIEATILHYVDNLDAKTNMIVDCIATGERLSPWLVKKAFPLERNLILFNTNPVSEKTAQ